MQALNQRLTQLLILGSLTLPALGQDLFDGFRPPEGWTPPPLNPTGVQLETRELGPGVYELLSNRLPFKGSGSDMLFNKKKMSYDPLSKATTGSVTGLDDFFLRALSPDPFKRYRSPKELLKAFEAGLGDVSKA